MATGGRRCGPDTRIGHGDGAMNLWSPEGGYNNYLATSPTGTATGFGASLMIIDDLIKNAEEANNELVKEKHWACLRIRCSPAWRKTESCSSS